AEPAGGLPYAMPATPHAMWQPEPNAEEHSGLEEIKPEEPAQPEGQPAAEPPKPPVKPWVPEDEPSTPGEKDGTQAQPSFEPPQQKPDDGESVSWSHEQ
ncbi:MAG TPA: hypothetical protein VLF62_05225, partial [Candidatus Saccharimonadales bacterium]|nr:hypothetical protein [Candidatus Saccharimonadales bacterium]